MAGSSDASNSLPIAAALLRRQLTAAVAFLGFVLLLERAGYAGAYRTPAPAIVPLLTAFAVQLLFAAPALLYLAALWQLRAAAAAVAGGAAFQASVVRSIRAVGVCLIAGATTSLLVMPLLHRFFGQPYPRLIDLDISSLILGGLGLGLLFLSRLVERAEVLQAELDEIF